MTAVHRAFDASSPVSAMPNGPFSVLPGTMQRSQVGDLLREIKRALALSGPTIDLLMKLIDMTRPRDWTDPDAEPVCFATQTRIANDLGCTPRQIRNHEAQLFKAGLIEDRRRANGSRSKHGLCGLGLSPLIDKIPDLLALRDRLRSDWSRQERLVSRRSVYYRRAKQALMDLQLERGLDDAVQTMTDEFLGWPSSRALRSLSLAGLESHLRAVSNLVEKLETMLENTHDSSGRAEEEFRPHIQATTEETLVDCSADAHARPASKLAEVDQLGSPPHGVDSRERKSAASDGARNPSWINKLTPQRLYGLATSDFQLYIDHETAQIRPPRITDFTLAALARLPDLGISPSAWRDAVDQMGEVAATLSVLIIDANRYHPTTPVKRPGGALRAMTRRHAAEDLNLVGSLAGLADRLAAD